jgi:hypothetical protein
MNSIIPIVLFCAFVPRQDAHCDATTAMFKHELPAVSTPSNCLTDGTQDAAKTISDFTAEHPNKPLEYRILCKGNEKT